MMTLLMEREIEVRCSGGTPRAVRLREGWADIIDILDIWRDVGRWWAGEKEKTFYRVQLCYGGLLEIYRVVGGNRWMLYRIYD